MEHGVSDACCARVGRRAGSREERRWRHCAGQMSRDNNVNNSANKTKTNTSLDRKYVSHEVLPEQAKALILYKEREAALGQAIGRLMQGGIEVEVSGQRLEPAATVAVEFVYSDPGQSAIEGTGNGDGNGNMNSAHTEDNDVEEQETPEIDVEMQEEAEQGLDYTSTSSPFVQRLLEQAGCEFDAAEAEHRRAKRAREYGIPDTMRTGFEAYSLWNKDVKDDGVKYFFDTTAEQGAVEESAKSFYASVRHFCRRRSGLDDLLV
ncbi:hypothetical protein L228DRAFT_242398 [Xylona heveae TC161]|uniref:Uncharacterized protein n=1 Tax=Xylona heveae (strain CBS 132557 / TC161) TaxID=1328760 RepID=A0A165JBB6_XYLHT|nr:hypothetical protein L228DRAFT_242398 [Xylona heveae TC161]KZF26005.1 hypothetical protein L228DRAFT_242398 [Xylona heveae TC161]